MIFSDDKGLQAITLNVLLLAKFGPHYLGWDSDALRQEMRECGGEVGPMTWDRVQALRVMHMHDGFWKDWEIFAPCVASIIGLAVNFDFIQSLDPDDLAVAVVTARRVNHALRFSGDVPRFVAASCLFDGYWALEDPLDFAAESVALLDKERGTTRPHAQVASLLSEGREIDPDPQSDVAAQANHTLNVRHVLQEYRVTLERELPQIPAFLEKLR